ncbi:MAG: Gfo/Idh/MocA family oxidoreductase [Chloroflexi bacterium]|nr:Gfo/Idh/MocA family oxidoreductase [Chloroflexota bacterium]
MMIRTGIVGLGHIAETHLPRLTQFNDVELAAFCDLDGDRLQQAARRYSVARTYTDLPQMLEHSQLDCVFILTPDWAHPAQSITCLEHGVHVFCEKPAALTLKETQAMAEAEARSGRWLMIGYNRRFKFAKVKAAFAAAPPEVCVATYVREEPAYRGLIRGTCHVVDPLRWICGEPKQVKAVAWSRDTEREGNILAVIEFAGGTLGTVISSHGSGGLCERLEAHGNGLSVFAESNGTRIVRNMSGGKEKDETFPLPDSFYEQDRHFIDCVKYGAEPLISGKEAVKTMELLYTILGAAGIDPEAEPIRTEGRAWILWCPYCSAPLQAWAKMCAQCGREMGGWSIPADATPR